MIQRGQHFRFTLEPREPIRIARPLGQHLDRNCRFRFVSVARYTSPMPPAPRAERISYEPRRAPGLRAKVLRDYTGRAAGRTGLVSCNAAGTSDSRHVFGVTGRLLVTLDRCRVSHGRNPWRFEGAHSSLNNRSSADASKPAKMGTAEKGAGRDYKQPPAVPK